LKEANAFEHLKNSRTVFDSTGIALQDLVSSKIILEHAERLNIGQRVQIESASLDEKNPYAFIKNLKKT
jgi:ornithine cyclodeaminase/alanine dehydrogenase-like protein (mu-crystallin family)